MPDVPIPSDKLATVLSPECADWLLEHCPGSIIGFTDGLGCYCLDFSDAGEAEAFRVRWLTE